MSTVEVSLIGNSDFKVYAETTIKMVDVKDDENALNTVAVRIGYCDLKYKEIEEGDILTITGDYEGYKKVIISGVPNQDYFVYGFDVEYK